MHLDDVRQFYAEEIQAVANLKSKALARAFAKVPREHFLGPGPWQIASPDMVTGGVNYRVTEDDDPRHLYHNVLVAIDPARNLNNGQPSTLAFFLDSLDLQEGERVLHIGCGVGYYTAIIAETVGPAGQVIGIEVDAELAERARNNLADFSNVQALHGDGATFDPGETDAILINAGATHPRALWLDSLRIGGRLLLPLTFSKEPEGTGSGLMLKVKREEESYAARFVSPVSIYPFIGVRDNQMNNKLREAMMRGTWATVRRLRRDPHEPSDTCWLHGSDFCLSA
ncbi:MAG TPA: methyltransferase domain-containing protein [Blastocatellia bacterium]